MSEIIDRLRDAFEKSGLTQTELEKRSGVKQPVISYVMSEKRDSVSLETVDALAKALGLELRPKRPRK